MSEFQYRTRAVCCNLDLSQQCTSFHEYRFHRISHISETCFPGTLDGAAESRPAGRRTSLTSRKPRGGRVRLSRRRGLRSRVCRADRCRTHSDGGRSYAVSKLPQAEAASVTDEKIRDYLLDQHHPQNGGKSNYFRAFGFDREAWTVLRSALCRHPVDNDVIGIERSQYGAKYVVRCHLDTPDGRNPCVTTIWIVLDNQGPRLVTAYP